MWRRISAAGAEGARISSIEDAEHPFDNCLPGAYTAFAKRLIYIALNTCLQISICPTPRIAAIPDNLQRAPAHSIF